MTEYFKKFTMDKDKVTIIDFGENEVYQCRYPDEAKSLCNRLNNLDYEKYNLKKENEQLKQELQKIYDVATINKTREIVDSIYDELLYETSEESEHKRSIILKCLEKLDDFRDDVE